MYGRTQMKNKNVPAFPCPTENVLMSKDHWSERIIGYGGMNLRDYFAAKALQGIIAQKISPQIVNATELANDAYMIADEMMEAREK